VTSAGSRRINGVRNFRQALASPHPVLNSRFVRGPFSLEGHMTNRIARFVTAAALAAASVSCALSLHNPNIADLQRHAARYQDRTVSVSGVVTSSWGLPLVPFRLYKVDDGTGQVTVISQGFRTPAQGEHVRVKGRVGDLAILGGRPLGLHLREESLYVRN
jgi:hypothetical protein